MKEEPLDFKLIEMLNTPICKMDGKDLVYLIKGVLFEQLDNPSVSSEEEKKHYVFGFKGIAQLFGCSISTASRIKRSGVIDDAITLSQGKESFLAYDKIGWSLKTFPRAYKGVGRRLCWSP